jgi:hypothetical protein
MMKWFDAINIFVSSFIICQSQTKKRARALGKIIEVIEV